VNWFGLLLNGEAMDNLESILLISPVADLSDPLSPVQDAEMQIYNSFSDAGMHRFITLLLGAGIIVLNRGDGILTHLPWVSRPNTSK
jgi:hypothetical protein